MVGSGRKMEDCEGTKFLGPSKKRPPVEAVVVASWGLEREVAKAGEKEKTAVVEGEEAVAEEVEI